MDATIQVWPSEIHRWRGGQARRFAGVLLGLLSTIVAGTPNAGVPQFVQESYRIDSLVFQSPSRIASGDFDGDGKLELVFGAWSSGSDVNIEKRAVLASLVHGTDGEYRIAQALRLPSSVDPARVLTWSDAGSARIILVGREGTARIYGGHPLAELAQFPIVYQAQAAAVGDIDADSRDELLVLDDTGFHTYSLPEGRLLKNYAAPHHADIAVAQLDIDPALEIVLTGATSGGKVIDGATFGTDWEYPTGFGDQLAIGDFSGSGVLQWTGAKYWYNYAVFSSTPWQPLWTAVSTSDIGAIGTARSTSASHDLVLIGEGQWGFLNVIDGISGQTLFSIRNDGYYIFAATGEDLDGDNVDELVFTSGQSGTSSTALTVANGIDGSVQWQFHTTNAPYSAVAHGDIDGDGRMELIAANEALWTSTLAVFDSANDALLWRSPVESFGNEVWQTKVRTIALRERPTDAGMDMVVAGNTAVGARFYVVDGITKDVVLDINGVANGPLANLSLIDMTLIDHDDDGSEEIAILVRAPWSGGALTILLWNPQGTLIWQSAPFGDSSTVANRLLFAPGSNDGNGQLLAVLADGIRAFDVGNGLASWVLPTANDGATYVTSGQTGPELAVFSMDGRVMFYDVNTRMLVRQHQFPAPLRSLQALGGHLNALLATAGDSLVLVDGRSGQVRSESAALSPFWQKQQPVSATPVGERDWLLASPTPVALYRHRLETPDEIFTHGFD